MGRDSGVSSLLKSRLDHPNSQPEGGSTLPHDNFHTAMQRQSRCHSHVKVHIPDGSGGSSHCEARLPKQLQNKYTKQATDRYPGYESTTKITCKKAAALKPLGVPQHVPDVASNLQKMIFRKIVDSPLPRTRLSV